MKEETKVDLGSIQIHKKVIADIAYSATTEIDGVGLIPGDFRDSLYELLGQSRYPGITVSVDKNSQVTVEVKVIVRYGLNIPETARHAQDAIRAAIEKTININLKEVNVNIQGIERGDR